VDGQAIYKNLRENYGITGAGGQDQLKGKIFRIAHLGYADTFDIINRRRRHRDGPEGPRPPGKAWCGCGRSGRDIDEIIFNYR